MEGTLWGEPPLTDIDNRHDFSARGLAPVTGAQKSQIKVFGGRTFQNSRNAFEFAAEPPRLAGRKKRGF